MRRVGGVGVGDIVGGWFGVGRVVRCWLCELPVVGSDEATSGLMAL